MKYKMLSCWGSQNSLIVSTMGKQQLKKQLFRKDNDERGNKSKIIENMQKRKGKNSIKITLFSTHTIKPNNLSNR